VRAIDPIVSTDWLETNIDNPDLVILDVRNTDEYAAGHIPGAVNSPEFVWYTNHPFGPDWPWLELPAAEDLFATIGSAGITGDSLVVVVSRTVDSEAGSAAYALAGATRVADTLLYAGIKHVAVLDGGWDKWVAERRPVSTDSVTPTPVTYAGEVNEAMFVSKDDIQKLIKQIGRCVIIDARNADVYFGVTLEPWATAGHIPGATCLPTRWLWNAGEDYYTYKDIDVLRDIASSVVGGRPALSSKEIIVYCGVGGYTSTMYFVLSEVLGYGNVKMYDGSAQEWTADPEAPVNIYMWE
jgi:thiosulfate/3-mercaptopyruvate sulfurtransferase